MTITTHKKPIKKILSFVLVETYLQLCSGLKLQLSFIDISSSDAI